MLAGSLSTVWNATRALFSDANARVGAHEIYALWSAPPFGMKLGIQPVILTAFLLAHKANIAVYKDGMFVPRLTDFDIDECLQDPDRFSLRWVTIDEDKNRILEGISKLLAEIGENAGAADPLEAARGLVAMVFNLPEWARRTSRLGQTAKDMRDMLLKASDPHKVLFVDLASLLNAPDGKAYVKALRAPLQELAGAYGRMLGEVETKMFEALDASPDDLEALRERASSVSGVSGDLRLDAFATRFRRLNLPWQLLDRGQDRQLDPALGSSELVHLFGVARQGFLLLEPHHARGYGSRSNRRSPGRLPWHRQRPAGPIDVGCGFELPLALGAAGVQRAGWPALGFGVHCEALRALVPTRL